MRKLAQQMTTLAQQVGGSHKTVHDRMAIAKRFCHHLLALNIQSKQVAHIRTRHIEGYIQHRLTQGISKRTLQNEMATLRAVLQQAGRDKLASDARLSNRTLGLAGASRNGTKQAIPERAYQSALQKAQATDPGFAAALTLARLMGLRSQEAVQCAQSLKTWRQALANGEQQLRVVFGTKGGRPRMTTVQDSVAVKQAVDRAISIAAERNGRLIDATDLKTAMNYWHNQARRCGLTGEHSPHSLRYAWAQDAVRYWLAQGLSKKEALAQVSTDLGHGDGRGRYIRQVYGRGMEE
ncbi:integrase domain-containing protein [Escherichia coli]|uniref:integrase domain-containing protein n=1 Tax=Escherichia coli TaxID=562 RepID=UPI0015D7E89B|nr:integrase domain-containing protein [Escherichia coli]NZD35368.1 integrase domain-containing protein [Escherichia coli]